MPKPSKGRGVLVSSGDNKQSQLLDRRAVRRSSKELNRVFWAMAGEVEGEAINGVMRCPNSPHRTTAENRNPPGVMKGRTFGDLAPAQNQAQKRKNDTAPPSPQAAACQTAGLSPACLPRAEEIMVPLSLGVTDPLPKNPSARSTRSWRSSRPGPFIRRSSTGSCAMLRAWLEELAQERPSGRNAIDSGQ